MNPRTRIDHDGSRDVDVQSLFFDQLPMVRRIARMEQKRECTQCPHVVGDSFERDCAFPDCIGGWPAAYDLLHSAHQEEKHAAKQRIAELEAERDDYRERWEQTGCTRHTAMESAIKLAESYRQQLDDMAALLDRVRTECDVRIEKPWDANEVQRVTVQGPPDLLREFFERLRRE